MTAIFAAPIAGQADPNFVAWTQTHDQMVGNIIQARVDKALAQADFEAGIGLNLMMAPTLVMGGTGAGYGVSRASLSAIAPRIAIAERGFISGDAGVLFAKGRAAAGGDLAALGEINAAKALRAEGMTVHFQAAAGDLGIQGVRTSDVLVGGTARTRMGGIAYDVLTPVTGKAGNIVSAIGKKLSQADRVIINLDNTSVGAAELGNVVPRVNGIPGLSRPLQEAVIVQGRRVVVRHVR